MKPTPLVMAAFALLVLCAARPAGTVGFQWGMASDPDDKPLQVAIWYPSGAAIAAQQFGPFQQSVARDAAILGRKLPLIVMSHGTGGSLFNSFDTAIAFCRDNEQDWGCRNARQHNDEGADPDAVAAPPIAAADARIKAAILAAPALAEAFAPNGLAAVKIPVQLWIASQDDVAGDADRIRRLLPAAPDEHVVEGAGHFAFLAPCSDILKARAPEICEDPAGFDRPAFLKEFQQAAVAFYKKTLSQ